MAGPARACATILIRARRSSRAACPSTIITVEVRPLGQDAPHLDGRSYAVRTQEGPSGPESPRGPAASPNRREDVRREGSERCRPARRIDDRPRGRAGRGPQRTRSRRQGRCHPPERAARRKSRLTRKVNAALGGAHVTTGGRVVKTTGKAAAAKAAKARIAAGKAGKAKGAQTAAGKARAALSKTARAEAAAAKAAAAEASVSTAEAKPAATKSATKASATKTTKTPAKKPAATAKAAPKATAKAAPKKKAATKE